MAYRPTCIVAAIWQTTIVMKASARAKSQPRCCARTRNDGFISLLAWRQRIQSRDGFKNFNDFVIARQRRHKFLLLLSHQRRRLDSNDFFVLFVKSAIFESIANALPEDLGEFLRCARRQVLERSSPPKNPRHRHEPALYAGAHEGFDFR